jgi:peptidoglycan/xylan/chitin deacetylase (PgdA/CDA1 family)
MARDPMALPTRTRRSLTRVAEVGARHVLPTPDPRRRRVVLCYHSVDPSPSFLSLTPGLFEEHLAWLQDHCQVVALDEVVAGVGHGAGPYVAITFDDGYEDNHVHAMPRLTARKMTATFFVTAGFVERDDAVMTHLSEVWLTRRDRLHPLSWGQVQELRDAGMSIGSHTWSHRNLARLSMADAEEDLRRSREVLEERLREPVRAVAYPWGKLGRHVTDETFAAARRAGYELGMISLPRAVRESDGPLRVPRLGVGAEPVERLAAKVVGAIDWHGYVHERMPARVARRIFAEDAST